MAAYAEHLQHSMQVMKLNAVQEFVPTHSVVCSNPESEANMACFLSGSMQYVTALVQKWLSSRTLI